MRRIRSSVRTYVIPYLRLGRVQPHARTFRYQAWADHFPGPIAIETRVRAPAARTEFDYAWMHRDQPHLPGRPSNDGHGTRHRARRALDLQR
jgi:hypothetical protein